MPRILVLYYSRTENTEKMAKAVTEGAKTSQGLGVKLSYYADPEALGQFDGVAVGMPTYHHDITLDTREFFEEVAAENVVLKGKIGAAFGSYGRSGRRQGLSLRS